MSKYTKGPWRAISPYTQGVHNFASVAAVERWSIVAPDQRGGDPEADARLIASAPQLLEALQALCDELFREALEAGCADGWTGRVQYQNARAALAAATGSGE